MNGWMQFMKAIAVAATKLQDDGSFSDGEDDMRLGSSSSHGGFSKWKLPIFINGVEMVAVCDGEKRGVFADEPRMYYATAREIVKLVKEKADGTSTSSSHNKDQVKIEILGANVREVAKMQLGRLMSNWERIHPPVRVFKPYTKQELLRRKKETQARRVTMYGGDERLPKAGSPGKKQQRAQQAQDERRRVSMEEEQEASEEDEAKHASRKEKKKRASKDDADQEASKESRKRKKAAAKEAEEARAKKKKDAKAADAEEDEEAEDDPKSKQDEEDPGDEEPSGDEDEPPGTESEYETQGSDGEAITWEDGKYVLEPVPMTFAALSADFIACFRNLEELSVKYYDDRVRGFPAFAYQHNPLARLLSLRNIIGDLEMAQEQVSGSRNEAERHVRQHFPGTDILNLYLRGFPDRFRDQLNSNVTTEDRYVESWVKVLDRIEEMLNRWNRTNDVVYLDLLTQIQSRKKRGKELESTASGSRGKRGTMRGMHPGNTLGLDYINSVGELDGGLPDEDEEPDSKKPANDTLTLSKNDLQSIIAAVMAGKEGDVLGQARTQDRNRKRDSEGQSHGRYRNDGKHRSGREFGNRDKFRQQRSTTMIGSLSWQDRKRIADEWLAKLGRDAPSGLTLCLWCHQWNFTHIAYGCPHAMYERDAKAMPVNNYPASREAQTALRIQDEEALEAYKAKHGGKTPREVMRESRTNGRSFGSGGRGYGHYGPGKHQGKGKDFR